MPDDSASPIPPSARPTILGTALMLGAAALLLGACASADIKDSAAASMRSWCRNTSNCDVHDSEAR